VGTKTFLMKQFTLLLSILFSPIIYGQFGCTDSQASNFNASASINDGSCLYNPTNYSLNLVANLVDTLSENSGLVWVAGKLYTFNDSGSGTKVYEVMANGTIIRSIHIANSTNVDWEAMTSDSTYFYLGDFGNNNGNRTDLCIYRLLKSEVCNNTIDTVVAEKMNFSWSDQLDFTSAFNANNFDCEAFYATEDSLFLFSKNWVDLKTKCYALPNYWTDTLNATLSSQFDVDGLITDACKDTINDRIYLLGYKNNGSNFYTSFIWCLWDHASNFIFSGNKRRIEIGNVLTVSQTEGIALSDNGTAYVSAEKVINIITIPAKLFTFNFSAYFEETNGLESLSNESPYQISYILINEGIIELAINVPFREVYIEDIQGKRIMEVENKVSRLPINDFHGLYFLRIDNNTYPILLSY
jgi:hypothetical protein